MLGSIFSGKLHDSKPRSFAAISMPSLRKTYSKKLCPNWLLQWLTGQNTAPVGASLLAIQLTAKSIVGAPNRSKD
jgi:hypothetical protein